MVWLPCLLAVANGWFRPPRIQPLDVPHHHTDRHKAFLKHMPSRHKEICSVAQEINTKFGAVTVMTVNYGQHALLLNFLEACKARAIPCADMIFVFPLDSETDKLLNVNHYHYKGVEHPTAAKAFSDRHFTKVVFYKNAVVFDILMCNVNVLFQDVDVVWKRNPIPELKRYGVDMAFMNDGNSRHQQPIYINSGFFFVTHNARTVHLWREAFEVFDNQNSQQSLLQRLLIHHHFNNNLSLFVLPPYFCNGNAWTPIDPRDMLERDWIVAHASWTQNATFKVMKLKIIGEWYLS